MKKNKIECDEVSFRNDRYTVFKKYRKKLIGTDYFNNHMLNIPTGWWVSKKEAKYIVEKINKY